jgi:transposase
MRTYSTDLRERIVAARAGGQSAAEIARLFKLSKRSVERYCKLQATTGSVQPKRRGGYRRSRLEKHDETLRRWIKEQADLTLAELQQRVARELKVRLGVTALWHRLEQLGLSYKKNAARRGAKPARRRPSPSAVAKPATQLAHRQARLPR